MSAQLHYAYQRVRASFPEQYYALSCISIDSEPVTVLPRFGGDFSGEEKMPEMASIPCSSRVRSSSVMPVFLHLLSVECLRGNEGMFVY
jgi:hypothetical protein